jgi:hypothetical protein
MEPDGSRVASPANHAFRVCGRLSRRNETPQLDENHPSSAPSRGFCFVANALANF